MFTIQAMLADGEKKNFLVKARTEQDMREWIEAIGFSSKSSAASGRIDVEHQAAVPSADGGAASSSDATDDRARQSTVAYGNGKDLYRLKFNYFGQLSHRNMLHEPKLANVHLRCADGQIVHAHDFVFETRCVSLAELVNKFKKKKRTITTIDLEKIDKFFTSEAVRNFLEFVYGDIIPQDLRGEQVIRVLHIASHFKAYRCELLAKHLILRLLEQASAFTMLKEADDLQNDWCKKHIMSFVHQHSKVLLKQKEESRKLGMDLLQEVIAMTTGEPEPVDDKLKDVPPGTLKSDFSRLFARIENGEAESFVKIGSAVIYFHRAILSSHAKGFFELFCGERNIPADCTKDLGVKELQPEAFRALLKFVYYGDANVPATLAADIGRFAEKMFMHDFANLCNTTLDTNLDTNNAITVLHVTQLEANKGKKEMQILRQKALDFIVANVAKINLAQLREVTNNFEMAFQILSAWQQSARNSGASSAASSSAMSPPGTKPAPPPLKPKSSLPPPVVRPPTISTPPPVSAPRTATAPPGAALRTTTAPPPVAPIPLPTDGGPPTRVTPLPPPLTPK
mmetsp:Transcript_7344/g.11174  ORF Transcript_7344/g.11174 Transcript_7344/m.11174 type:complete len:568 (+) Transcript_7344:296-1999(+)